jgi:hypothetical protein
MEGTGKPEGKLKPSGELKCKAKLENRTLTKRAVRKRATLENAERTRLKHKRR